MVVPFLGLIIIGIVFLLLSAPQDEQSPLPEVGGGSPEPMTPSIEVKVKVFAEAIARAEGFYIVGSVPNRANNPGDLGPGDCGDYPVIHAVGSDVCQLPDDFTGWQLLYTKLRRIFTGQSSIYNVDMTIEQMAMKYAGDWRNWANNVAYALGIPTTMTIREWLSL